MFNSLKERARRFAENNRFNENRLYACACLLAFVFCVLGLTLTIIKMSSEKEMLNSRRYENIVREMVPEIQARLAADSTLAIDAGTEIRNAVLSRKVDSLSISLAIVIFVLVMIAATGIFITIQIKRKKLWKKFSTSHSDE